MKKLILAIAMFCAVGVVAPSVSHAQTKKLTAGVGQLVQGLVNVNVGAVQVNVSDITLEDLVDV